VVDPQVSRCHVRLERADGRWKLISLGRNGTRVEGRIVSEHVLTERVVFQLGVNGPLFKFATEDELATQLPTAAPFVPGSVDFLSLDETKKAAEVEQIAGGDAFRNVQQRARELKQKRNRAARDPLDAGLGGPGDS